MGCLAGLNLANISWQFLLVSKNNQTRSRQGQAQEFWTLVYGLGTSFNNVLLEYGELPCVLPLAVHLDFGHLLNTLGAST